MSAYTDADVQAFGDAVGALYDDGEPHMYEEEIGAGLDAIAPALAARALREASRKLSARLDADRISRADLFTAMSTLADEIERGTP